MGLHITQAQYKQVLEMFAEVQEGTTEIEAKLQPSKRMNFYQYQKVLKYFDCNPSFVRRDLSEQLDILPQGMETQGGALRISLSSLDGISHYCKTGRCINPSVMIKARNTKPPVKINEHNVVVQFNTETLVKDANQINHMVSTSSSVQSLYRLKKRVSYVEASSENTTATFRIDCTIVKQIEKPSAGLKYSYINDVPPSYEVEVEYIGGATSTNAVANRFLSIVAEVLKVVYDTDYLIPNTEAEDIIKAYCQLALGPNTFDERLYHNNPKALFVGPQPVSFDLKHLVHPMEGWDSVLEHYTLTHKADGERTLVYVHTNGAIYTINNRLNVKPTKLSSPKYANSLFDAEAITQHDATMGASTLLLLFDSYFVKGESVLKNLLEHHSADQTADRRRVKARMEHAREFAKSVESSPRFKIQAKDFLVARDPKEFYNAVRTLLIAQHNQHACLPYETDGIIFTPRYHPVGAATPNGEPQLSRTWDRVLKWKPADQNSIDFLVSIRKDPVTQKEVVVDTPRNGQCKILALYVADSLSHTTPSEYLRSNGRVLDRTEAEVPFTPETPFKDVNICYIPISSEDGTLRCMNSDIVSDNSIVEMSWDSVANAWKPMRVRFDKTDLYKSTKRIRNTANTMDVALSIWRTIMHPVREDHLVGKTHVGIDDVPPNEIKYYDRRTRREDSALYRMNEFHNRWVKSRHLLERFVPRGTKNKTLMDIGCGKGGDINKWLQLGFTTVLGVDLYRDNIVNPFDGAYARLMRLNNNSGYNPTTHKYVFLQMDATKKFDKGYIDSISEINKDDAHITRIVWGLQQTRHVNLSRYYNLAKNKFDIISCQFAVHYLFESQNTLEALAYNVSSHLKPGGIFLGTCFDAYAVNSLLRSANIKDNDILTSKDSNSQLVWAIRKMYKGEFQPKQPGQAIGVYIQTINQFKTEYLVDYDLLVDTLAKVGVRPLNTQELHRYGYATSSGMFSQLFQDLQEAMKSKAGADSTSKRTNSDTVLAQIALNMTETEKQQSFLNRWFAFIKAE